MACESPWCAPEWSVPQNRFITIANLLEEHIEIVRNVLAFPKHVEAITIRQTHLKFENHHVWWANPLFWLGHGFNSYLNVCQSWLVVSTPLKNINLLVIESLPQGHMSTVMRKHFRFKILNPWLVGGFNMFQPLWKIWVRQMGWWFQIYLDKYSSHVPVTTNQMGWNFQMFRPQITEEPCKTYCVQFWLRSGRSQQADFRCHQNFVILCP